MATGFALITISPLHEKEVYKGLTDMPQVVEVHPLFGEYDILVKIEGSSIDMIGKIVIKNIRSLKGVVDTKTLVSTESLTG